MKLPQLLRKRPREGPPLAFSLVWLCYMVFPISALLAKPWEEEVLGFSIVAVFTVIYMLSYLLQRGKLLFVLGQIVIIGYFAYRYDVNFLYLGFYPSPLIGMLPKLWQSLTGASALVALFVFIGWHHHLPSHPDMAIQLLPALLIMLFMPVMLRIGRRSKELRDKLVLANEEIARLSKIEERQRISRDLHDTLGHTLSLITLKSELAEKLVVKQPDRAIQEIRDIQFTSRSALKQVRELVTGMNAATVRDELTSAKQILAAAGIVLETECALGDGNAPPPLVDNILGMCLKEAVTNVVKHSRAGVCRIAWAEGPDRYTLTVSDNGVGSASVSAAESPGKNGLNGMRERLKLVDGRMEFGPAGSRGTRVVITVPKIARQQETEGSHA
ncbi:sensor histidine kinase [Cohnella caldifontis]|uniref:sensor histidine kinase n=1 Tax=Cohnella caldifontis TaxID=3027471 RepID=UPI0023EBB690|nr:sensor histidine kinase [Cohnella sp. YIM B05605]